eukprot:snap_masked-scaffold1048_size67263-processed-gene-0.9 protein:Tk10022 transcript:snap_masked-scaffold1048_size67263-processed-gene-0.9-mRNA-1 annotation:"hypothetical protein DAPPUDRAFT_303843"
MAGGEHGEAKSQALAGPPLPKDGQVMAAILKDMGIVEYEGRVLHQLLEFSYRYVTQVLEDAKVVSGHALKKAVDVDDVKLAVQMYAEQNMTGPLSRELLLDAARAKNRQPLPIPRTTCGLRLPPDRHCLTACNYRMKFRPKPKAAGYGLSGGSTAGGYKAAQAKMVMPQTNTPFALVKGGGPKPVFKINAVEPQAGGGHGPVAKIQMNSPAVANAPAFKIQINPQTLAPAGGAKRKADAMDTSPSFL